MQKLLEKNRGILLVAVALFMGTTMFPSIWSVFQAGASESYGITLAQSANLFPYCNLCYGLTFVIAGRLAERLPGQFMLRRGALVMSLGVINLSLFKYGTPMIVIILGFSVLYGCGCGFLYPAVLTSYMRWYADKNGFANGVVMAGSALVLVVLTYLSNWLLVTFGVQKALFILGIGFMAVSQICATFICNPTSEYVAEKSALIAKGSKGGSGLVRVDFTTKEMMKTKQFYLLYIACTCSLPVYLLMSSSIVTFAISRGLAENLAVSTVAIATGVSAVAKFVVPTLSDKVGRKKCAVAFLSLTLIFAVVLLGARGIAVMGAYIAMFVSYGVWGTLIVPFTNDLFGLKYSGQNQGVINTYNALVSFTAPILVSLLTSVLGGNTALIIGIAGAVIATAAVILIDTNTAALKKERQ